MTHGDPNGPRPTLGDAYALVASILHCRKDELTPESSLTTTPGWDSMAQVEIMLVLGDEFGIEITDETIATYSRLGAIQELMTAAR